MDEQPAVDQTPSDDAAESSASDDLHRKFQEALARKHERAESPHGQAARARGVGPSSGGHTQRQFRRKSG